MAEVWLIDVDTETIVVSTDPAPRGYRIARPYKRGDEIESSALGEYKLNVDDIFGERATQTPE